MASAAAGSAAVAAAAPIIIRKTRLERFMIDPIDDMQSKRPLRMIEPEAS
jgi:hypothetical protein